MTKLAIIAFIMFGLSIIFLVAGYALKYEPLLAMAAWCTYLFVVFIAATFVTGAASLKKEEEEIYRKALRRRNTHRMQ